MCFPSLSYNVAYPRNWARDFFLPHLCSSLTINRWNYFWQKMNQGCLWKLRLLSYSSYFPMKTLLSVRRHHLLMWLLIFAKHNVAWIQAAQLHLCKEVWEGTDVLLNGTVEHTHSPETETGHQLLKPFNATPQLRTQRTQPSPLQFHFLSFSFPRSISQILGWAFR